MSRNNREVGKERPETTWSWGKRKRARGNMEVRGWGRKKKNEK